ncbi:MAG: DUF721 domain-containing protein, partial [Candidatus Competibacteraceae bacterium]|nr:DUF721 domain-containing protein [Candidatus Competibacteraceae bacterium]
MQKVQGTLAGLLHQGQQLARLQRILDDLLPVQLQGRATLVRLDPEAWVVQAESPVWATRLRFSLPALRQQLAQRLGTAVPPLKIKVAPATGL